MSQKTPFRLTLGTDFSAPVLEGDELELVVSLSGSAYSSNAVSSSQATHAAVNAPEIIAWMLAGKISSIPWNGREPVVEALLLRALQEAARDGVAWTRLLDRLAVEKTWGRIAKEQREGGRTHLPRIPTPEEQASGLRPWIESRERAEELDEMLNAFETQAVRDEVALYAHQLTPNQMELLKRVSARSLSENKSLGVAAQREIVRGLFKELTNAASARGTSYGRRSVSIHMDYERVSKIKKQLELFATKGEGFTPELQLEVANASGKDLSAQGLLQVFGVLLKNPDCTPETLRVIVERGIGTVRAEALLHPNATDELRDFGFLEKKDGVAIRHAVSKDRESALLQERHLWAAVGDLDNVGEEKARKHYGAAIIAHPASTREMWMRLAMPWDARNAEIMTAIASNAGARRDRVFSELLKKSSRLEVWENLILDASAEEFPEILKTLMGKSTETAFAALRKATIPEGAKIPDSLAKRLLTVKDQEDRLFAMTLLSRLKQNEMSTSGEQQKSEAAVRKTGRSVGR